TRSCRESPPLVRRERHRRAHRVVVADEHAPRVRDEPAVGPDLMLELEAFRPNVGAAAPNLDVLTRTELRAEVDLDAGENERLQVAEDADTRLLEVGRIDGVVDVPHGVAV